MCYKLELYNLRSNKITGILDNSPNKIGKYLYGYNLLCSSFNELLKSEDNNIVIFIASTGSYINEIDLTTTKVKLIFIQKFDNI